MLIKINPRAGGLLTRRSLGLPDNWEKIEEWINNSKDVIPIEKKTREPWKKKNLDIPVLNNYQSPPHESFWQMFLVHYPRIETNS
jgi:hypothetical protein